MQQLRDLVKKLTADNQRLQNGTAATSGTGDPTSRSSTPSVPVTERLIYVPRDRKCPMFGGRTGLNITEWVEEVQACMRTRHLSPVDKALFIYDHLEGEAREEIKYRPRGERQDPEKVPRYCRNCMVAPSHMCNCRRSFFLGNS